MRGTQSETPHCVSVSPWGTRIRIPQSSPTKRPLRPSARPTWKLWRNTLNSTRYQRHILCLCANCLFNPATDFASVVNMWLSVLVGACRTNETTYRDTYFGRTCCRLEQSNLPRMLALTLCGDSLSHSTIVGRVFWASENLFQHALCCFQKIVDCCWPWYLNPSQLTVI